MLNMLMLHRSQHYLDCVLDANDYFERGLLSLSHGGTMHYYMCIQRAQNFQAVNAIEDAGREPDSSWKRLMADLPLPAPAEVDIQEIEDLPPEPVPDPLAIVPLVPALPRMLPAHMKPQKFEFACGEHTISVHLDGFSHASGHRRAYGQCPYHKPERCYKYTVLSNFDKQWKAVAFVLCYLRRGDGISSKFEHMQVPPATEDDMAIVFDELPAAIVVDTLPDRV